jgi:hypothetical protein
VRYKPIDKSVILTRGGQSHIQDNAHETEINFHLGGSNSDFRASVDMDTAVTFARDRGTDSVSNTNAKGTTFQTVSHGKDGIGSFTRLGYKDADIVTENGSLSIQKVRSKLNLGRNFGQLFKNCTCLVQK